MDKIKLKVEKRVLTGRKLKQIKAEGFLAGNVYGKGIKSEMVQVLLKEFEKVLKMAGETGIVSLELEGKDRPVLIGNVQRNPKTDEFIHVDFRQVDLKERIEAQVPVVLVGESPAEKQSLGTVVLQLNEITVEALPMDLPEKFEVNIDGLSEVDQAIYVKDLKVSKDVEVKSDIDAIVAKVEPPQKEEVIEAPVVAEGETPATNEETGVSSPESTEGNENSGQSS